jgi:hypothetical protein
MPVVLDPTRLADKIEKVVWDAPAIVESDGDWDGQVPCHVALKVVTEPDGRQDGILALTLTSSNAILVYDVLDYFMESLADDKCIFRLTISGQPRRYRLTFKNEDFSISFASAASHLQEAIKFSRSKENQPTEPIPDPAEQPAQHNTSLLDARSRFGGREGYIF